MAKHEATVANVLDDCFRRLLGKTGKTVKTKARLKKGEAQRLWKAGILGVGYGVKETAGGLTPVLGARVYVRHKRSLKSLNQGERIPEFVLEDSKSGEGLNTDVVAVPGLRPLNGDSDPGVLSSRGDSDSNGVLSTGSSWLVKDLAMLRSPHRPLTGGASVGPNLSAGDMAGTLGCFVKDSAGKTYILSNNHVLANSRLAGHEQENEVQPDADIFQPGTLDWSEPYITDMLVHGSKQGDPVAKLAEVVPIQPSDPTVAGPPAENRVDAALARITPSANRPAGSAVYALPGIPSLKAPPSPFRPRDLLLTTVAKVGRTTGATLGVVVDVAAQLWIPYGRDDELDKYAWMVNQIAVVPVGDQPVFSAAGDSGSAVFDARTHRIIGLLFAGGGGRTFVNPIDAVFSELGVQLA